MTCQIVHEIKKYLNNVFNETFFQVSIFFCVCVLLNFNPLLSNSEKLCVLCFYVFFCYSFAHLNTTILQQNINFLFVLLFILRANNFHELFAVFVFFIFLFVVFPFSFYVFFVVVYMLVFLIIKQHCFFFFICCLIVEYKGLLYVYRSCSLVVFPFFVVVCLSQVFFPFFLLLFYVHFISETTNKRNQQWHRKKNKKWHI